MSDDIRFPAARSHPVLHAAPTFRPIAKGRRRLGLERVHKTNNGVLKTKMFYELDVADQDLLLCIFAIARSDTHGKFVDRDLSEEILSPLLLDLSIGRPDKASKLRVMELPALQIEISKYELLMELKRDHGSKTYKWLTESLDRLASVGFNYDGAFWAGSFNLLSWGLSKETGQYTILINPISSHSIWADKSQYIFVQREERHQLKLDAARCLHSYLSGVIWHGETKHRTLDSLAMAVLCEPDTTPSAKTVRNYRAKIRDALLEIDALKNWSVDLKGKGSRITAKIIRKKGGRRVSG